MTCPSDLSGRVAAGIGIAVFLCSAASNLGIGTAMPVDGGYAVMG